MNAKDKLEKIGESTQEGVLEREFRNLFNGFHDPPTEEDVISFLAMNGLIPQGTDPRGMPRWPVWNSLKGAL